MNTESSQQAVQKLFFSGLLRSLPGILAVSLASIGVGMFANPLTDELVDTSKPWEDWNPSLQPAARRFYAWMGGESDFRIEVLTRGDDCKLTPLGQDILLSKAVRDQYFGGLREEELMETRDDGTFIKENQRDYVKQRVHQIYYDAKNWCYRDDNYFVELEQVKGRADAGRTVAGVSVSLLVLHLALLGPTLLYLVMSGMRHLAHADKPDIGLLKSMVGARFAVAVLSVVCLSATFFIVGATAYRHYEKEFDKRVFGYYRTHDRLKKSCWGNSEVTKVDAPKENA